MDAISSVPSGRNPSPDGAWPGSGRVVISPCRVTVCTASPSMSENQSRPSNQRGPSPKQKPLASGVSVAPLQNTPQVSRSLGALSTTCGACLTMKHYHRHTLLYLHETIGLGSGRSDGFSRGLQRRLPPDDGRAGRPAVRNLGDHAVQRALAAGHDHLGDRRVRRLRPHRKAQARGGSHADAAAKWATYLSGIGAHGEGRIMYAGRATGRWRNCRSRTSGPDW